MFTERGVSADNNCVKAITDIEKPTNRIELLRISGMAVSGKICFKYIKSNSTIEKTYKIIFGLRMGLRKRDSIKGI